MGAGSTKLGHSNFSEALCILFPYIYIYIYIYTHLSNIEGFRARACLVEDAFIRDPHTCDLYLVPLLGFFGILAILSGHKP